MIHFGILPALLILAFPSALAGATVPISESWIDGLLSHGFTVQEGQYGFFNTTTCLKSDTCYADNPITPYGLIYLPPSPSETSTGNYSNTCHIHNLCRMVNGTLLSPNWRVAQGEAIAVVGQTPPESTYWSFSNYIYSRYHPPGWRSNATIGRRLVGCPAATTTGNRCEVFSGINDPLNMETVKVPPGDTAFESPLQLLLTWDSKSESAVADHMTSSVPVNTLRFPGSVTNLGVTRGDEDEFLNVFRLEGVQNHTKRDQFYADAPFKVYRITPPNNFSIQPADLFPSFQHTMRTRWTGIPEHGSRQASFTNLKQALARLTQAVVLKHQKFLDSTVVPFQSFVNDSGYECLEDGTRCQGDCRDTIYAKATLLPQEVICNKTHLPCKPSRDSELTDNPSDKVYLVGVNHHMTNQSLYSSLTAYNFPKLASGVLMDPQARIAETVMETTALQTSAAGYLPDDPLTQYLFVVEVARDCTNATGLCYKMLESSDERLVITTTQPVVFIERMYIHPGTKSGPSVEETILPNLIHFRERSFVQPLDA